MIINGNSCFKKNITMNSHCKSNVIFEKIGGCQMWKFGNVGVWERANL